MKSILLATVFLFLTVGVAASQTIRWCEVRALPIYAPDGFPAKAVSLEFASVDDFSQGRLEFVNTSAQPIKHFLIVAELLNKQGEHVLTVPFFNLDLTTRTPPSTPLNFEFKAWLDAHIGSQIEVIKQSKSIPIQFWSPLVVFDCPLSARIVLADFKYTDGSVFQYRSPELNIDPVVSRGVISSSQDWRRRGSEQLWGRVDLDSEGQMTAVELNAESAELIRFLKEQISRWKFTPAVRAGSKSSSHLTFLLTIGRSLPFSAMDARKNQNPAEPVTSLRVAPPVVGDRWKLEAGGFPVSGGRR